MGLSFVGLFRWSRRCSFGGWWLAPGPSAAVAAGAPCRHSRDGPLPLRTSGVAVLPQPRELPPRPAVYVPQSAGGHGTPGRRVQIMNVALKREIVYQKREIVYQKRGIVY